MKKTFLLTLMVAAVIILGVSGAWAYEFNPSTDSTQVVSYLSVNPGTSTYYNWSGYWHEVISDPGVTKYNIAGADLAGSTLKIYTGWPGAYAIDYGAKAADLTLVSAGNVWMVRLYDGAEKGELFLNPTYQTSFDIFGNQSNLIYGGAYGNPGTDSYTTALHVPVWALTGLQAGKTVTVTWNPGGAAEVDITLSGIQGFDINNFSFLYASATCANSVLTGSLAAGQAGQVPLPPTALLLGSGILGLVGLGWRRSRKEG